MSTEPESTALETRSEAEPSSLRLITTLSLAGLLSGLVLVGAYQLTLPRIQANQARELREAVFKVLPGTERMQEMELSDGRLRPVEEGSTGGEVVYAGYDSEDDLVGYAIPGEGPGFQDTIKLIYGYIPERRVIVGMEVLESRETPGLGDRIIKDQAFRENFKSLSVEPEIVAVKSGAGTASNEVDTITGATISSNAVVRIINNTNAQWLPRLGPGGGDGQGSPREEN